MGVTLPLGLQPAATWGGEGTLKRTNRVAWGLAVVVLGGIGDLLHEGLELGDQYLWAGRAWEPYTGKRSGSACGGDVPTEITTFGFRWFEIGWARRHRLRP
jgi:hypothetical protein